MQPELIYMCVCVYIYIICYLTLRAETGKKQRKTLAMGLVT
jgi:hypothetical protein